MNIGPWISFLLDPALGVTEVFLSFVDKLGFLQLFLNYNVKDFIFLHNSVDF